MWHTKFNGRSRSVWDSWRLLKSFLTEEWPKLDLFFRESNKAV
jgi:hypothetical protein